MLGQTTGWSENEPYVVRIPSRDGVREKLYTIPVHRGGVELDTWWSAQIDANLAVQQRDSGPSAWSKTTASQLLAIRMQIENITVAKNRVHRDDDKQ